MSFDQVPPPVPRQAANNFTLAGWDRRVLATLIDSAISIGLFLAVVLVANVLLLVSDLLGGLVGALGYLGVIGFGVWQLIVQGRTGATIGKARMRIRVVKASDAQHIGPGLSIGRAILHVLDSLPCYVGYLWPLWDEKRQTFADKVANTVVVDDRARPVSR